MNKKGEVFYNNILAGVLEYQTGEYIFDYDATYIADSSLPPVSLSFPKKRSTYRSPTLFPFFYGLLAEGNEKKLQCSTLKIDENDHFTRLLKTAGTATIGAITVKEVL